MCPSISYLNCLYTAISKLYGSGSITDTRNSGNSRQCSINIVTFGSVQASIGNISHRSYDWNKSSYIQNAVGVILQPIAKSSRSLTRHSAIPTFPGRASQKSRHLLHQLSARKHDRFRSGVRC